MIAPLTRGYDVTRHRLIAIAALSSFTTLCACDDDTPATTTCAEHEDCADTEICDSSRCHDAYGQRYILSVMSANLPTTNPEGGFWDPTGGAPDPKLALTDQEGNTCTTPTAPDTASPNWSDDCGDTFDILEETRFTWVITDDDSDEDAEGPVMAESAEEFGVTVQNIRDGNFSDTSASVMVNFRIQARY
jgi:hypothetical protein